VAENRKKKRDVVSDAFASLPTSTGILHLLVKRGASRVGIGGCRIRNGAVYCPRAIHKRGWM
jgi:hypothetical protein